MTRRVIMPFIVLALALAALPMRDAHAVATPEATPGATPAALEGVLPTLEQVPEGMARVDDRERTLDEVVRDYDDPAEARDRFAEWGWRAHHSRSFEVPPAQQLDPTAIEAVYASVDAFGSPDAAANALDYAVEHHISGEDHEEVPIDDLGHQARALYGEMDYGNEMTIYAVKGDLLIRVSASSRDGDPRETAIEIMETILADA